MIQTVGVVGAGTMGFGIALQFALNNVPTIVFDKSESALRTADQRMRKYIELFIAEGISQEISIQKTMERVTFTTNMHDLADLDFVTECVTENLDLKQSIFQSLDEICKKEAILASNTSSLRLSDITVNVKKHQSRCILTHWFNPPHIIPLVELLESDLTDPTVYETVKTFLREQGKVTIDIKKEIPGLVANRIQVAMAREVLSLLEEGVASPEDLDLAITEGPGFRLSLSGVLEIMDFGGLDVWNKVIQELQPKIASHQSEYQVIHERLAKGDLGAKTGKGFYQYPNQSFDAYVFSRDAQLLQQLIVKHNRKK